MRLLTAFLLLSFLSFSVNAQIKIKNTDVGKPWDEYVITKGKMDAFFVSPHRPNRNVDIDIYNSALPNGRLDTVGYYTPAYSEFEDSLISNDNLLVHSTLREEFYTSTDGSLKLKGFVKYMTLGNGDVVPVQMTFKNGGFDVLKLDVSYGDSVRRKDSFVTVRWKDTDKNEDKVIKGFANRRILADGFGRIKMSDQKSYDFLRVKTVYGDTLFYYTDNGGELTLDSAEVVYEAIIELWAKNWGYPLARFGGSDEKFSSPKWYEVVMPNQVKLSINEAKSANVNVFPNPSNNNINIAINEPATTIALFTIQGKSVFKQQYAEAGNYNINLDFLSQGTYILKAESNNAAPQLLQLIKE